MNKQTPTKEKPSTSKQQVDSDQEESATDSLHYLPQYMQKDVPPQKWYENAAVQMLVSTLTFSSMSAIVIALLMLFSEHLSIFIDTKTVFTVEITDKILRRSTKRLQQEVSLLPDVAKDRVNQWIQDLTAAAVELGKGERFILKSAIISAPKWLQIAVAEYTQQKKLRSRYSNRIGQYLSSVADMPANTLPTTQVPWSAHFINWVIEKANLVGTDNSRPEAWLNWGKPITGPVRGSVVVATTTPRTQTASAVGNDGYKIVGVLLVETPNYVILLAGDVVSALDLIAFPKSNVLGYRWPHE